MKPLPLIEPDMQISSIRLTDTRRCTTDTESARRASEGAEAIALQTRIQTLMRPKGTTASLTRFRRKQRNRTCT